MCIAIYSPVGTPIPSEKYLSNCFKNNPDGAGFAFNLGNGQVQIVKGLMTFDKFKQVFNKYNEKYGFTDRGVLIHFRITTHGGTQPACCHPFPLSDSDKLLKKTECVANYAVIHNGIIQLTSTTAHALKNMSDTMVFVRDYMSKIASNKGWFRNPNNWELIETLADSKIACLNGQGEIQCTSGFHEGVDGNFYSNTSYSDYYCCYKGYGKWKYLTDDTYSGGETYGTYDYGTSGYGTYDYGTSGYGYSYQKSDEHTTQDRYYSDVDPEDGVLMRLKPTEKVYYRTNYTDDYDPDVPMFLGESGSIYAAFEGAHIDHFVDEEALTYMGLGCFVNAYNPIDENNEPIPVPFREDTYVLFNDYDDEDEPQASVADGVKKGGDDIEDEDKDYAV